MERATCPKCGGGGSSPNGELSLFTHSYRLDSKQLPGAKVKYVGIESKANDPITFSDFTRFNFGGGGMSATGIRDKGGFTVVPMDAPKGRTKLCVSLAVKEEQAPPPKFRLIAVDAENKRHEPQWSNAASAGGNGTTIITMVSEFDVSIDKVRALVVQKDAQK